MDKMCSLDALIIAIKNKNRETRYTTTHSTYLNVYDIYVFLGINYAFYAIFLCPVMMCVTCTVNWESVI